MIYSTKVDFEMPLLLQSQKYWDLKLSIPFLHWNRGSSNVMIFVDIQTQCSLQIPAPFLPVYDKIQYGDKTTAKSKKNSKKLTKNHVILVLYQWATFKIMHIRTPAVQHKKLTKKIFFLLYINWST